MQPEKKISCFGKLLIGSITFFSLLLLFIIIVISFAYYKLTNTNELALYLSKKLSRTNKYNINIENLKNTFPIITAENVNYRKLCNVSSLTIDVGQLVIFPDYLNLKEGSHSFLFNDASMYLRNKNFLMDSPRIELFGNYCKNNITIASSTFNVFGGKIYLSGNIDCNKKPSPYEVSADLIYVRLQDILEGTKNKGLYTGDVYGKLKINSFAGKKSPILGEASLSITNGTYYKPELVNKINAALYKIGLQSTLKDFAGKIGSSTFTLNGDFILKDNSYETNNAELKTSWSFIKFSGIIGPKSALNGTLIIKINDYSDFTIKVNGENSKNLSYKISSNDKAKIASILFREISKGTEKRIKKEGRSTNRKLSNGFDKLGKRFRNWMK